MKPVKEITFNNGVIMPPIGLGVYQSSPEDTAAAVEAALAGGMFLLLAGIEHIPKKQRLFEENVALGSDVAIGVLMIAYFISSEGGYL